MFGSEQNVRVRSGTEPEPPFGFMFSGFAEPSQKRHDHRKGLVRKKYSARIVYYYNTLKLRKTVCLYIPRFEMLMEE